MHYVSLEWQSLQCTNVGFSSVAVPRAILHNLSCTYALSNDVIPPWNMCVNDEVLAHGTLNWQAQL